MEFESHEFIKTVLLQRLAGSPEGYALGKQSPRAPRGVCCVVPYCQDTRRGGLQITGEGWHSASGPNAPAPAGPGRAGERPTTAAPPPPPADRELRGAVLRESHHSGPAVGEAGSGCSDRRRKRRSWTKELKRRKGEDHGRRR